MILIHNWRSIELSWVQCTCKVQPRAWCALSDIFIFIAEESKCSFIHSCWYLVHASWIPASTLHKRIQDAQDWISYVHPSEKKYDDEGEVADMSEWFSIYSWGKDGWVSGSEVSLSSYFFVLISWARAKSMRAWLASCVFESSLPVLTQLFSGDNMLLAPCVRSERACG